MTSTSMVTLSSPGLQCIWYGDGTRKLGSAGFTLKFEWHSHNENVVDGTGRSSGSVVNSSTARSTPSITRGRIQEISPVHPSSLPRYPNLPHRCQQCPLFQREREIDDNNRNCSCGTFVDSGLRGDVLYVEVSMGTKEQMPCP
jgi:hypothetical protein